MEFLSRLLMYLRVAEGLEKGSNLQLWEWPREVSREETLNMPFELAGTRDFCRFSDDLN
jgi:hypothetical protein